MKKLARHLIDADFDNNECKRKAELFSKRLEKAKGNPKSLDLLYLTARSYAGILSVVDPTRTDLCRALQVGGQAVAAIFATASVSTGEVSVVLDRDSSIRMPATGPRGYANADTWLNGFFLAVICRDDTALEILCQTPIDVLRRSSGKGDEYVYLYVDALQGLWKREKDTSTRLLRALKATDPDQLHTSSVDYTLDIAVPEMELIYRYMLNDAAAFNEALFKALELHRKYWSKGDHKRDPYGFLALGPLAIASLAYDDNMPIEVESDYLPMRLVRGDCKQVRQ